MPWTALQLNLYARILEQKYGVRVAGLWIGVMHAAQAPGGWAPDPPPWNGLLLSPEVKQYLCFC